MFSNAVEFSFKQLKNYCLNFLFFYLENTLITKSIIKYNFLHQTPTEGRYEF